MLNESKSNKVVAEVKFFGMAQHGYGYVGVIGNLDKMISGGNHCRDRFTSLAEALDHARSAIGKRRVRKGLVRLHSPDGLLADTDASSAAAWGDLAWRRVG